VERWISKGDSTDSTVQSGRMKETKPWFPSIACLRILTGGNRRSERAQAKRFLLENA
jgi:hypothetical protein